MSSENPIQHRNQSRQLLSIIGLVGLFIAVLGIGLYLRNDAREDVGTPAPTGTNSFLDEQIELADDPLERALNQQDKAYSLARDGRYEEAIELLEQSLAGGALSVIDEANVRYKLAGYYAQIEDFQSALLQLDRIEALDGEGLERLLENVAVRRQAYQEGRIPDEGPRLCEVAEGVEEPC